MSCIVAVGKNSVYLTMKEYSFFNEIKKWKDLIQISTNDNEKFAIGLKKDGTCLTTSNVPKPYIDFLKKIKNVKQVTFAPPKFGVSTCALIVLKKDGTCDCIEDSTMDSYTVANSKDFVGKIREWKNIKQLSVECERIIGLKEDGTCIFYGESYYDSYVKEWKDIISVSSGGWFSVGLKEDGTCVTSGANDQGQINIENWNCIVQIVCGAWHTVGLKKDGTCIATGINGANIDVINKWTNIIDIFCYGNDTIAINKNGTCVMAGQNFNGMYDEIIDWKDIKCFINNPIKLSYVKYLIKQNDNYISIKPSLFKELGKPKDNAELLEWYDKYGTDDLNNLLKDVTVDGETFRPIDKLDDEFDIVMLKDKTMD